MKEMPRIAFTAMSLVLLATACQPAGTVATKPDEGEGADRSTPAAATRDSDRISIPEATRSDGRPDVAGASTVHVNLAPQNGFGISGTATLSQLGPDRTRVDIRVDGTDEKHPGHIHEGTCENLNPVPKWRLNDIADGTSTTDIPASLAEIAVRGRTAINLHKSAQELSVYVACGDIQE